jgi:hypothetical protein
MMCFARDRDIIFIKRTLKPTGQSAARVRFYFMSLSSEVLL